MDKNNRDDFEKSSEEVFSDNNSQIPVHINFTNNSDSNKNDDTPKLENEVLLYSNENSNHKNQKPQDKNEIFSTSDTSKDIFKSFGHICKLFFTTLYKKLFSQENKDKFRRSSLLTIRRVQQILLFMSHFLVMSIIKIKNMVVKYSLSTLAFVKKLWLKLVSEQNRKRINNFRINAGNNSKAFIKKVIPERHREKISQFYQNTRNNFSNGFSNKIPQKYKKFPGVILPILLTLFIGSFAVLAAIYTTLPDVSAIRYYHPDQTTEIYDINHKLISKIYNDENRLVVPLKSLPEYVVSAVVAMEDERFYQHQGIDFKSTGRAFTSLIIPNTKMVKSGGSTITQQLARNIYLSKDRTIKRKIQEMLLALKMENNLSKDRILEVYLNEVYWGHNAYGIEAASKTYFGKSAKDLSLAEASLIGGLLSSPETYSPYKDYKLAKWRQSLTLENMVKNKFISNTDAEIAKKVPITLNNGMAKKKYKILAPYFSSYVVSILENMYGDKLLKKGGLKVYTTIDLREQQLAENILSNEIKKLNKFNIHQGSLVSIDPTTGFIKAMVGGVNYETSQFNRVTQAFRQPGSAFKPFVYLTGFKSGLITPNTFIKDEAVNYNQYGGNWSPQNYGGGFRGNITVRQAIKESVNTVAVKTLSKVGINKVVNTARKLGIESKLTPNLSLALGTSEVSPIEMITAYSVFANHGKKFEKVSPILKIVDRSGKVIEDFSKPVVKEVYNPKAINMLNICLKEVVSKGGTGHVAAIPGVSVAGKTGTTTNNKDSWFIGYVPKLATLVWVGNDDNSGMRGATGGQTCAPIWKKYMTAVLKKDQTKLVNNNFNNMKIASASIAKNTFEDEENIKKANEKKIIAKNKVQAKHAKKHGKYKHHRHH